MDLHPMKTTAANAIGIIDASVAGVSGDKYLGALIDLGGSQAALGKVGKTVEDCLPGTRSVQVVVESVERGEVAAKLVRVESREQVEQRKGDEIQAAARKCLDKLALSEWARGFVQGTIETLLSAESRVHGHSGTEVELHELGSADTLVDVLGVACLVEDLGLPGIEWWSTSLSVGGGKSHFSGRDYPNPPPAVAEIFRAHRTPFHSGLAQQELTTPTGAAITVNLARNFSDAYPVVRSDMVGYGAGSREIGELANVLRITLGEKFEPQHSHDRVVVLETNLDDVTGEVIGHVIERVMEAGARDVTVAPVYMKKNRPGHLLSVIVDEDKAEELARIVMDETGSLGIREIPVRRHIIQRTVEKGSLRLGEETYPVRVKKSLDGQGRTIKEKIEYEDRKQLAKTTGLSIREIDSLAKKQRTSK